MPRHVFQIEQGLFGLSITDPGLPVDQATISDYSDFTCQVTSGALNATPNITNNDVPATWCEAGSSTPSVGQTTFELAVTFLQDPDVVDGLNRFLFQYDTQLVYFFVGLAGGSPPRMTGQLRAVAGTIGGEARVALTADVTLPVEGRPNIEFGNATESEVVVPAAPATGATAGTPGTWSPSGALPPPDVPSLIAGSPAVVVASPATAWTVGQFMQTRTGGVAGQASWNGTAWETGVALMAASRADKGTKAEKE